jgi:hypothetical protein
MQSIPNKRAQETEDVSNHGRNPDERDGSQGIERFDHVDRLDHVRPENEIDERLRPAEQNQECPEQMPPADQRAGDEPNFVRISHFFDRVLDSDRRSVANSFSHRMAYYCFAASIRKMV